MEENEMLETTNETENIEQTTEEMDEGIELTDTTDTEENIEDESVEETKEVKKTLRELLEENPEYQEELNEKIIKPRLARQDRQYQKELSKYKDTENVLKSTLNVSDGEDVNQKLREVYEADGVKLPSRYEPGLSTREIEALANIDAEDIIAEGHDATVAEANRLASKKYENLNKREQIVFNKLAEHLTNEDNKRELLKLGAKEELLSNKEFNDFRKKFNSNVPIKDIYNLYNQTKTKKNFENPGSMKNIKESPKKTFYTDEEISKLTSEELDNPEVWDAVRKSMTKRRG